jgi:hypothetical protein
MFDAPERKPAVGALTFQSSLMVQDLKEKIAGVVFMMR